jgi:hypothetical protein
MLLMIVGQDQSILMARKLSLSQCIAIDFEEQPGICLNLFEFFCPRLQIRASDCAEVFVDEMCEKGSSI